MKNSQHPEFDLSLKLTTKRLELRIFEVEDITKEYVKALNDPKIIGLTESRYTKWTLSDVKKYVKEKAKILGESILLGIFLKADKRHIGSIRLHSFSKINKRVELGILIWDNRQWGKNYGTEALRELIKYLFNKLKLHKICAEYYSINKGSAKMFKKLGFRREGVLKDHFIVSGSFVDAVRIAKLNKRQR